MNKINLVLNSTLLDIYIFIRQFRLGTEKESVKNKKDCLSHAGSWQEMNSELFDEYMSDIAARRKNAFSSRGRNFSASQTSCQRISQ